MASSSFFSCVPWPCSSSTGTHAGAQAPPDNPDNAHPHRGDVGVVGDAVVARAALHALPVVIVAQVCRSRSMSLRAAQVPPAAGRVLRGGCEILDGVARRSGPEVTRRKEVVVWPAVCKRPVRQPGASCQTNGQQQRRAAASIVRSRRLGRRRRVTFGIIAPLAASGVPGKHSRLCHPWLPDTRLLIGPGGLGIAGHVTGQADVRVERAVARRPDP
ncbi:hypothetical protein EYF80_043045 [Liparis tanakae]|uniref:Uncharacterized protein n=1 Tax=Liparis tanakae TaxID=230148 RepID=A0A4Z2G0S0_9TELE|nr:hypothetical protein EYF80_043045 [Liparis tanakae]